MAKILTSLLLFSFCLQGFHIAEEPTLIKPYMAIVPLVLLWTAFNGGRISKLYAAEYAALLFFCFMTISALWAKEMPWAVLKLFGIVLLLSCYFAIRAVMRSVPTLSLLKIIGMGGIFISVLSLIYYTLGIVVFDSTLLVSSLEGSDRNVYGLHIEGSLVRMRGIFDSPNNLSLVCVFLFLFYDFYKFEFSAIGKALTGLSVILSLSLTGFLALAVGYLIGMFFHRRYSSFLWISIGVLVFSVTVHLTVSEEVIDRMIDTRVERTITGSGRWDLYEYTFEKIADKPIFGYGLNQSRVVLKEHREMQSTHNSFLEAAIDGGVLALIIFSLSWFLYLTTAFKLSSRYRQPFYFASAISLFVFSQLNLLTFVEITVLYFAIWFEIAVRGNDHILESESASQAQFRPKFTEGL
jgi:hypothetical protein